ncbi:hypothetical protein KJ840_04245 [Patescibacteria group bacterium]|nr:hypothetical protein [Patescibacteria group bacterium]
MTEAGYPGVDIESQERSEIQNKRFYDITLWLGTPTADPQFATVDSDLFLIYIKPHVIADYDWQHTCEIITINKPKTEGFAEIYTNIYNSLKVREY